MEKLRVNETKLSSVTSKYKGVSWLEVMLLYTKTFKKKSVFSNLLLAVKQCHTYLEISLGNKIAHSLDHPDGYSVRLCQSVQKSFAGMCSCHFENFSWGKVMKLRVWWKLSSKLLFVKQRRQRNRSFRPLLYFFLCATNVTVKRWKEWRKDGWRGLHTHQFRGKYSPQHSFLIIFRSTSKASAWRLVFLWMWSRWVTLRTKEGRILGVSVFLWKSFIKSSEWP